MAEDVRAVAAEAVLVVAQEVEGGAMEGWEAFPILGVPQIPHSGEASKTPQCHGPAPMMWPKCQMKMHKTTSG